MMFPGPPTGLAGFHQPLALQNPACLLTQLLPATDPAIESLLRRVPFELLTARNCLNLLLKLTERYVCTGARRMLIEHVALNFEALMEEGALWQLPCRVWQEVLIQDCLAVSC